MLDVAITGAGLLSPIGGSLAASWDGFIAGRVGFTRIQLDGTAFWCAPVDDAPLAALDPALRKRTDRFGQFALVAAEEALVAAALPVLDAERTAVVVGATMGGVPLLAQAQGELEGRGAQHVTPRLMALVIPNMAAAAIALRWKLHGPQLAIATACASSLDAIGRAARMIAQGEVDVALAGGSETLLTPVVATSLERAGALARGDDPHHVSLPFDTKRTGFVMADGCGIVVLERGADARARGAAIQGYVRGYASLADAYHATSPEPSGRWEARAIERALADAGIAADAIDALYAHGTATPVGDAAEIAAINAVYGARSHPLPVTSLKGHVGHGMAASGVTALAVALRGFAEGIVIGTAGTDDVEPSAQFDVVLGPPRALATRTVQINAFGFGGQNASLVVSR
ncbi:MAG TPA: beta-ketoacyl-[acyl-carrier-protein] synthase family protein [Candidatus Limnocylindria bacterium]|nr:beta-ketoacyl-[acyl-carrier-protein] synthase family protein [Candidatus Limnocylindria bacterium]